MKLDDDEAPAVMAVGMWAPVEAGGCSDAAVGTPVMAGATGRSDEALKMPCVAGVCQPSVSHEALDFQLPPGKAGDIEDLKGLPYLRDAEGEVEDFCALVKCCNFSKLCTVCFQKLCQKAATLDPCVLQLGLTLLQLLLVSPRDGDKVTKWITDQCNVFSTAPTRDRDFLPLPLPPVGAAIKLMEQLQTTDEGLVMAHFSGSKDSSKKRSKRQQFKKIVVEGTHQLWRVVQVLMVNGMNGNWEYHVRPKSRLTELQNEAMININMWVHRFCVEPLKNYELPVFSDLLKSKSIDYSGEEIAHALPLRLEELLPGLPLPGIAGSLSAVRAASGTIAAWVADPTLTLKAKSGWPDKNPRARINATRDEWYRICQELYKRGIIEPIAIDEVFCGPEGPVLNGAFAVEKKGQPGEGQVRVTRLIMNFVPTNSFQKLMAGDLNTLAGSTSWSQLLLNPNQVLLWSGDDQKGAFYAWELPKAWRPYMAFAWPVPGHLVGSQDKEMEYVASRVIPMGWIQAVSLFQHLHRQLGMTQPPLGAGHPEELEWRRDRSVPQTSDGRVTEFVQFYLDDFDCPEVVPSAGWESLSGTMSPTHQRQRASYERWGVGISSDKAHVRDPKVVRMGAEVDGLLGTISVPKTKQFEAIYFALWCMGLHLPPVKALLMVLGRLVRIFEFRRPLMCLLQEVWPKGCNLGRRPLSGRQLQELLRAIAVVPLAGSDLRSPISNLVTCSDASEAGGGLCCSGGLTEEGLAALSLCQSQEFQKTRTAAFQAQGAVGGERKKGLRLVVVSLFDGIAALMCALCRLDCQVVAFAASEVDVACKRLVRKRWPGVLELGDITKIDDATIQALRRSVGYTVDLVLCGGGSPCQDLSALLADREGLAGSRSKLFYEMPRIFKTLKEEFECPVHTFVENVFSMTADNRNAFSDTLGVEPILVDTMAFSKSRRPRLFWVDWIVEARGDEQMIYHDRYYEWAFPNMMEDQDWWLERGCTHASSGPLPTFTRALPRKKPPRQAAGLDSASVEAVEKWKEDFYRFQVYQYESWHMITKPDGSMRLPSLGERERLMGFPTGYVSTGLSTKLRVNEAFNLGACMIGNSFNVYAVTFLLDELLAHYDPSYQARCLDRILDKSEVSPGGWCEHPCFNASSEPDESARMLVQEFMRQGDRGGTDVKLDVGIPYRIKAWPRAGIRSRLFHWKIVNGYSWKHASHINVLELQALVHAVQWRLRKASRFRHRVLHLIDNQVVASVVAKGRSSSFRLRRSIEKLSSLLIAGGVRLSVGYVATDDNPSDLPSRWAKSKPIKSKNVAKLVRKQGQVKSSVTKY